jgi:hypothetical protein
LIADMIELVLTPIARPPFVPRDRSTANTAPCSVGEPQAFSFEHAALARIEQDDGDQPDAMQERERRDHAVVRICQHAGADLDDRELLRIGAAVVAQVVVDLAAAADILEESRDQRREFHPR